MRPVTYLSRRPAVALAAILTVAFGVHPALPQLQVTAPDFRDWRNQSCSFDAMAPHTL